MRTYRVSTRVTSGLDSLRTERILCTVRRESTTKSKATYVMWDQLDVSQDIQGETMARGERMMTDGMERAQTWEVPLANPQVDENDSGGID